jgi:hypothetical protein
MNLKLIAVITTTTPQAGTQVATYILTATCIFPLYLGRLIALSPTTPHFSLSHFLLGFGIYSSEIWSVFHRMFSLEYKGRNNHNELSVIP